MMIRWRYWRLFLLAYLFSFGVFTGNGQRDCRKPLGMQSGDITDAQLSAASSYNNNRTAYGPGRARLNHPGGYRANKAIPQTYLGVRFLKPYIITGIATQGYGIVAVKEWVKLFWLGYSEGSNTSFFKSNKDSTTAKMFSANNDSNTVVYNDIPIPAKVTSVHLMPIQYETNFAIRIELYGCVADGYECLSTPCLNGGTCVDLVASYRCDCIKGFNGTNCQYNIDDCASSPCLNGGTCIDGVSEFHCNCTAGYEGTDCGRNINECQSNPCMHGGRCIDGVDSFTCTCARGFGGPTCEEELGFFVAIWLRLESKTFSTSYLNESSSVYQQEAQLVNNEVTLMVRQHYGFNFTDIRKFSPVDVNGVVVEVLISCLKNSTDSIARAIRKGVINGHNIFAYDFFKYENRAAESCNPPNITIALPKDILTPFQRGAAQDLELHIGFALNCHFSSSLSYNISMYSIESSGNFIKTLFTEGRKYSDFFYRIPANTLPYGLYYVKIAAEVNKIEGTSVNDYGFLEITKTPLVANISGSEQAFKGRGELLRLSGSFSYDPDVGQGNHSEMQFEWLCRRENETFPSNVTSLPVVRPSSSSQDFGGCYGTGVGRLESSAKGNDVLELDVDRMIGNVDYVIALVVKKGSRSTWAYQVVKVMKEIDISLNCLQNCEYHVIPAHRFIVEMRCAGLLCNDIFSYEWNLYLINSTTQKWQRLTDLERKIFTYMNSPNLVTRENTLHGNTSYVLELTARAPNGVIERTSYRFITNSPPSGGTCAVDKSQGLAWETEFQFVCGGWQDEDQPLTYRFLYNTSDGVEMVFSSGVTKAPKARLPVGDKRRDFNLDILVQVADSIGSAVIVGMSVKVIEPELSLQTLDAAVGANGEMNRYLRMNNIELAAQRATSVLSVVNHMSAKKMNVQEKIKIKDSITDAWSTIMVNVTRLEELSQVAAVVAGVTDKRDELSVESQEKTVALLASMASYFEAEVANKSRTDQKESIVQSLGSGLLHDMGNMVWILSAYATPPTQQESRQKRDITSQKKSKDMVVKTLALVDQVGGNLLKTKELYEKPSVITTRMLDMVIDRQNPSLIGGKSLVNGGTRVQLPSTKDLINGLTTRNNEFLSTQMVSFKTNPYTWSRQAVNVKSSVLDFKVRNASGFEMDISNLKNDIDLFIPQLKFLPQLKPGAFFAKPSINGSMQYHVITIPGKEYAVTIKIKPLSTANLTLYVRYHQRPTVSDHNFTATIPNYTQCNYTNGGWVNCSSDPFAVTISFVDTGHVGLHYIGIVYHEPMTSRRTRIRKDCSSGSGRGRRALCVGVKDPPTTLPPVYKIMPRFDPTRDVNYTMEVSMGACLYWEEGRQTWSSRGCRVGPKSRPGSLHCKCDHLTSFGGDFFVSLNPIDFDIVFKRFQDFDAKNFVVFFVVFSILGLYLIALVFAMRADRKDTAKAVENLHLDISSGNWYEITIYTGVWRNNGTTANVAATISGQNGASEVIPLSDRYSKRRLFARASINTFTVSLSNDIGPVTSLKLWHDNYGSNPSWFIHQVVITNLETDSKTYFVCNRWLAVDKGDGQLEGEFKVASKKELSSFKYQFYSRLSRNLGDGHLWLSVVTRPPHSPFTRAQRLSCCLSVLYCAMVASAMFYQFGDKTNSTKTLKVGSLRLSLRQLVIGLQSAIVVVPVNVLIVAIFRNVKARRRFEDTYTPNGPPPKKFKTPGCLPYCFVYLGWLLCLSSAGVAASFTIFYSLSWGGELANQWLTSVIISFIQDIGVTQPLKVATFAVLLAIIMRKPVEENTSKGGIKARLEVQKGASITPPKGEELEEARMYRQNVLETLKAVTEIVFYLLFVICLFVFAYANRGYDRYRLTKSIDDIFTSSFEEVDRIEGFWEWSRGTLVPGLYDTSWYSAGGAVLDEGYISNKESFLVGMPRFRQLRMKTVSKCKIEKERYKFVSSFARCLAPYEPEHEYRTSYNLPKWIPVTNTSHYGSVFNLRRLCPMPWRYQPSSELKTLAFHGKLKSYAGGGFVADLGYNKRTALLVIDDLQANNWVDLQTVALFVEFTVFEPSTALFSHAKYLYEMSPATGKPTLYHNIQTLSLYASPDLNFRKFFNAIQIIILLLIFCYLIIEVGKVLSLKCKYFVSFWNWLNMLQLLTAIATVVLFFFKEDYVSQFVKNVQRNPYETTSIDYVILFSELELYVLSTVVFIVTIKFLRLLRFNRHICQMTASMKHSSGSITTYAIVFLIDMIAFAFVAILVLGITIENYSDFVEALSSLFQMFLGAEIDFQEIQSANRIIGPVFFFTYMITMIFILINMFVAILNDSYDSVRHLSGGKFPDTELGHFIRKYYNEKFRGTYEIFKRQFGILGYRHQKYWPKEKDRTSKDILGMSYASLLPDSFSFTNIGYKTDLDEHPAKCDIPDEEQEIEETMSEHGTETSASAATESSSPELLDLLSDLPESIVDDDDTVDNVRDKLSNVGAVLRLSKRSYRRFSTSGDKFVVEREVKLGPSVQLTFTPILSERKIHLPKSDAV
ncbi:polycystic kidney disease protein 1-like 2 isoform X1 [Nematostella vectensis]|uniref:polycystic kidney disease protein 1-like 2 isoform X1 n=1 Tax=Nematostella vectensis TaxID=45351 RepID=UPI0020773783|nr:polycystic kidney disease protein 1-like 2 isoform X1 [Nematostella vectensis]XP_048586153.1 polycystic kidney disease protein 1-like 2 isoform X1 [Nematostella vectensis]XP_048586154.1 polycystic kidney disease protein 1-like 2 isoform X1 [Nematostella vectensis]